MPEPITKNLIQPSSRRRFLQTTFATTAAATVLPALAAGRAAGQTAPPCNSTPEIKPFELDEITISGLQDGMKSGKFTARSLVDQYGGRIADIDKRTVNAVIELNPDALSIADALDHERKVKGPRGPLHGIPVLIKDNIDTADPMPTTAGSLALADNVTHRDAPLVARLRAAGAVILGKTNLSEWANIRSSHSISGWSAVGGQTKNPYVLDRGPCGSSAGSAVAISASLAAF